jgi:hypothetical protein
MNGTSYWSKKKKARNSHSGAVDIAVGVSVLEWRL